MWLKPLLLFQRRGFLLFFYCYMKKFTKAILIIHRYLGFVMSLLFVMWFISGFAMMYVSYPTMRYHQRLGHLPVADFTECHIMPGEAVQRAGLSEPIKSLRLGMLLERPIYRIVTVKNLHKAVFADNGEVLDSVSEVMARRIAMAFVGNRFSPSSVDVLSQIDQWMAAHRSQGYLPHVYRFTMDDPESTFIYVTVATGEVVQMVNARERFLAWLGPIPHWIYPTVLIRNRPLWSDVVVWTSGIGIVMCLAGVIMGIIRYKRKPGNSLVFSPYKKRWFRWHHYTGFVFGVFVFTWILSGFFSMSPIDFGPDVPQQLAERDSWTGGNLNIAAFTVSPTHCAKGFNNALSVKEIHLTQVLGKPYYLAYEDDLHTRLVAADDPEATAFEQFSVEPLIAKVRSFYPSATLLESVLLHEYDDYYYSRKYEKRLPVLRVKLDTPEQTWYYVDVKTGQIVLKHERGSRFERWLYNGLHSWDFRFLVYRRPLWNIVVGVLMLGGTLVSVTGAVLTWRWMRRKVKL